MIDLKTLSVVAAASAAVLAFSTSYVSAESVKAPLQLAQAGGSYSPGAGSGSSDMPSGNPSAMPGSGSSPTGSGSSSGSTARGADQCAQISDPRARQDCMQRQNDLRSGSGPSGNNPIGDGPGITNRGAGSK